MPGTTPAATFRLPISMTAGLLGLLIAPAGIALITRLTPVGVAAIDVGVNVRLLVFSVAVSIVTGLLFSVVPALQSIRGPLVGTLQQHARAAVGRGRATRDTLVVLQVAAALVLLVAAGLMLRTLANLRAIDVGFRADHLLTMKTTLPRPNDGSQPSTTENTKMSRMPIKNVGNDTPISEKASSSCDNHDRRCRPV